MRYLVTSFLLSFLLISCGVAPVKNYKLEVVAQYPHDTQSYTQGLFFHEGQLFESTGCHGKSTLRKVDLSSGEPLKRVDFEQEYFAEGSVVFNDDLYVLTWESHKAFIYDVDSFERKRTVKYQREGWGITTDGEYLIASDGSATLFFMDKDLSLKKRLIVKHEDRPVRWLNELEYIDGKIWANVYMTNEIVIIDPKDGRVTGVVDCEGLLPKWHYTPDTDVLNGIAYNPETGKIYLTGKNWPRLFEVKLVAN